MTSDCNCRSSSTCSYFNVRYYMFCHPRHVILRKGRRRLQRWQHLMAASDIGLTIRRNGVNGTVNLLQLSRGTRVLEILDPLSKYLRRSIVMTTMGNWVALKWTSKRGNTQFQLMLDTANDVDAVSTALENSGVTVHRRHSSDPANIVSPIEKLTAYEGDSQSTQIYCENSQQRYHGHMETSQWATNDETLTEESIEEPQSIICDSSSRNKPFYDDCRKLTDSGRQNVDAAYLIKHGMPASFSISAYSNATTDPSDGGRTLHWNHFGLASDLCISLVCSKSRYTPIVTVTRHLTLLESIIPHPNYVRGCCANDILLLYQASTNTSKQGRYIQLQLSPADLVTTREWLEHWGVYIQDHVTDIDLDTDATTMDGMTDQLQISEPDS